ncbi:DUF3865 domain-containing protein [Acinetobacter sp. ESBL14]|uniref:DUF3865 domain-containing protein n=1 Tax=Acinetobacter sp. ESBL14 TaxID=3077329 RepID=UPI002FC68C15
MEYVDLKSFAVKVATNECLLHWELNSESYTYLQFSLLVNNLRHWLAPTAHRLDIGCKILKGVKKEKGSYINIKQIIEAFEQNIAEEKGLDTGQSHAFLFIKSVEAYSQTIFKKRPIYEKGLPATVRLKAKSELLFGENLYVMLGAALAQEIHALPQLELLISGAEKNRSKFTDERWNDVAYFYDIHLDGTEERHAEDLNRTIWSIIDTDKKREEFLKGFYEFLDLLEQFWDELYREVRNAKP